MRLYFLTWLDMRKVNCHWLLRLIFLFISQPNPSVRLFYIICKPCVSICLHISLSVSLSISLYICLSISLSISPSVCLPARDSSTRSSTSHLLSSALESLATVDSHWGGGAVVYPGWADYAKPLKGVGKQKDANRWHLLYAFNRRESKVRAHNRRALSSKSRKV